MREHANGNTLAEFQIAPGPSRYQLMELCAGVTEGSGCVVLIRPNVTSHPICHMKVISKLRCKKYIYWKKRMPWRKSSHVNMSARTSKVVTWITLCRRWQLCLLVLLPYLSCCILLAKMGTLGRKGRDNPSVSLTSTNQNIAVGSCWGAHTHKQIYHPSNCEIVMHGMLMLPDSGNRIPACSCSLHRTNKVLCLCSNKNVLPWRCWHIFIFSVVAPVGHVNF